MKKPILFLSVLLFVVAISISRQNFSFPTTKKEKIIAEDSINSIAEIKGVWLCISSYENYSITNPMLNPDSDIVSLYSPQYVLIENDSVWQFDLPCEMVTSGLFKKSEWESVKMIGKDTLHFDGGYNRTYVRDTISTAVFNHLKQKKLNPECLYGVWFIVDEANTSYDGLGTVEKKYSNNPPKQIAFDKNNLNKFFKEEKSIQLYLSGKNRKFTVSFHHHGYSSEMIRLTPDGWGDNYYDQIYYSKDKNAVLDLYR